MTDTIHFLSVDEAQESEESGMSGESMSKEDWDRAQFGRLLRGLPMPLPMFDDGVACPWCGCIHQTITIGGNGCDECGKGFLFGYTPWGQSIEGRPDSFVQCPHREFEELGRRGDILPEFKPNERLLKLYELVKEMRADEMPEPQSEAKH